MRWTARCSTHTAGPTSARPASSSSTTRTMKRRRPGKASKKKKPWRYRWPDDVRDEVLGRLLELNAQRAKEEALAGAASGKSEQFRTQGQRKKRGNSWHDPTLGQVGLDSHVDDPVPKTPSEVRARLTHALALDLVGPEPDDPQVSEILNVPPSRWYLTGFLVPWSAPVRQKQDEDDTQGELGFAEPATAADEDDNKDEPPGARRGHFPSSIGISVLVPAGRDGTARHRAMG